MRGLMSRFSLAVAKLRFADKLCSACAEHGRPKVPMRKLSPSQSMKTEVHAPGFHAFALQKLSNKRHADGVPFARCARYLLPHFAFGKTGRTGAPQSAA